MAQYLRLPLSGVKFASGLNGIIYYVIYQKFKTDFIEKDAVLKSSKMTYIIAIAQTVQKL